MRAREGVEEEKGALEGVEEEKGALDLLDSKHSGDPINITSDANTKSA